MTTAVVDLAVDKDVNGVPTKSIPVALGGTVIVREAGEKL